MRFSEPRRGYALSLGSALATSRAYLANNRVTSCQIADISNSAIQIMLDVANQAVTGCVKMTDMPHPIMMIATAKVTRVSQRAKLSMLIAPVLPLYFDWRVLTVSSFRANNILRSPVCQS